MQTTLLCSLGIVVSCLVYPVANCSPTYCICQFYIAYLSPMVLDRSMSVATLKGMPSVEALWGLDFTRIYFQ